MMLLIIIMGDQNGNHDALHKTEKRK